MSRDFWAPMILSAMSTHAKSFTMAYVWLGMAAIVALVHTVDFYSNRRKK